MVRIKRWRRKRLTRFDTKDLVWDSTRGGYIDPEDLGRGPVWRYKPFRKQWHSKNYHSPYREYPHRRLRMPNIFYIIKKAFIPIIVLVLVYFFITNYNTIGTTVGNFIEEVNKPVSNQLIENAIFKYTNIERANAGVAQLAWDEQLAQIAKEHSVDMATNNFFSHVNLRGEDPTARAMRHGYPVSTSLGGGWTSVGIGENIGKMPVGDVVGIGTVSKDADSIAKALVNSWMQSTGHRENILNPQYSVIGVGVAYDGTYYIATQDFR